MTQEREQAELVEFEIVRGSEEAVQSSKETVRVVSRWQMVRFALLGLAGLALFLIVLGVGVMFLIPVLVFLTITRLIGSIISTSSQRR